ncbi:hypothetical protein AGMMS49938_18840 [Fibrobacterales bacterium]|nr:hypothetical protein AGMMS49938_18840 [Fibrobacterales bacterium]
MEFVKKMLTRIKSLLKLCVKIVVGIVVAVIISIAVGAYFLIKSDDDSAGRKIAKEVVRSIAQEESCSYNCAELANYRGEGKCDKLQGGQYKVIHPSETKALCYAASFNKHVEIVGHKVYKHKNHYHLTTHDYDYGKRKIQNGVIENINGENVVAKICNVN